MEPMKIQEILHELEEELRDKSEHYRKTQNDPHGVSQAAYVILLEVSQSIRKVREKIE